MKPYTIHITGASGSGVTTLGRALATATGAIHLDTDDFYWAPVEPKFSVKRDVEERLRLLIESMAKAGARGWILSGSIGSWGEPLVPQLKLVVYMSAPTDIRIERLMAREKEEFGAAVEPGGSRHKEFLDFVEWASHYDTGAREGRSRLTHEAFLAKLACPVLRLDGTRPTSELVARVLEMPDKER